MASTAITFLITMTTFFVVQALLRIKKSFFLKSYYFQAGGITDQVQMPMIDLTIIARYKTYTDSYTEYCMRRYFYESFEVELP